MNIRPFEGAMPAIDETAWVDDSAVVIGNVVIGADSSIWPATVVRGDINSIRIGARTNI
ncbi:MAG: gamma carbonic anhydrase family protein, partial [Gammaproteobacteria bacterium]